jgi:hypothetical protein
MIITVFRSRLMPEVREEYVALVDRMVELARTIARGACTRNIAPRKKRHAKSITQNIACRCALSYGNPDSNVRSLPLPDLRPNAAINIRISALRVGRCY